MSWDGTSFFLDILTWRKFCILFSPTHSSLVLTWNILLDVQSTAYSGADRTHNFVNLNRQETECVKTRVSVIHSMCRWGKNTHFPVIRLTAISGFKWHMTTWSLCRHSECQSFPGWAQGWEKKKDLLAKLSKTDWSRDKGGEGLMELLWPH